MRALLKLSCLILLFCIPISAQAQESLDASSRSAETFFTLLADARTAIDDADELTSIKDQLANLETVTLADGRTVPIDTSYWIDLLSDSDTDRAISEIDATLASRQLSALEAQPDARAQLTDVLTRFEIDTQFSVPLWQRVVRWLGRWLQLLTNAGGGQVAGGVVILIGILVTPLIIWWSSRRLRGEISAESHLPYLPDDDPNLTAQSAFDNAQLSADTGDYRTAVRYLYLSALLSLDDRDLLRFDRSKTNREYLRSVADSEFAPTLHSVIDVFDRVWYGFRPIDSTTFAHYRQQVSDLLQRA